MPLFKFAIITPTIGRNDLRACIRSVRSQLFPDYIHLVGSDGPGPGWAKSFCDSEGVRYIEFPEKRGAWGAHVRNDLLQIVENENLAEYVLFLDDDNQLNSQALELAHEAIENNGYPPLLYQRVLYYRRWDDTWCCMPMTMPPQKCFWDTLNGIYRHDVIKGVRWGLEYEHDFRFSQDAIQKAGTDTFIKVHDLPAGTHF